MLPKWRNFAKSGNIAYRYKNGYWIPGLVFEPARATSKAGPIVPSICLQSDGTPDVLSLVDHALHGHLLHFSSSRSGPGCPSSPRTGSSCPGGRRSVHGRGWPLLVVGVRSLEPDDEPVFGLVLSLVFTGEASEAGSNSILPKDIM